jgi:hypothetical protein
MPNARHSVENIKHISSVIEAYFGDSRARSREGELFREQWIVKLPRFEKVLQV